ncbi:MAG: aspartate kinase [Rickettsiales bacterium]|nr:aspartate kinase [Rickettsiales bacterium]
MALIVQKFGGTSVADIDRIRNVSNKVKREVEKGNKVAVVVSAMSGKTNELVGWVDQVSSLTSDESLAEYDTVVSSGEQVTSGLVALNLQTMGIKARSWLGWQLQMQTDGMHGKARIEEIDTKALEASLNDGEVAVVAGFQGMFPDSNRITTLGRGGSDTSAVALAAALKADRCDIYTDVDGVYTTDPRIVPKARKLKKVAYEEMLEMASQGAKVLQTRSVEMAMKHDVVVQVLSSFSDVEGTLLVDEEKVVERRLITGIAYSRNESQITLSKLPSTPGIAARIFAPLGDAEINVDMIVQSFGEGEGQTNMTFTVPKTEAERSKAILTNLQEEIGFGHLAVDENVAKISVIGVGMRSHAGLAQKMFKTLAEKGINILVITTSEIKISVLIKEEYTDIALRALHTEYGLDAA